MVERIKKDWLSNVRADILSGIVVALALIPEAIAFSIIAGVNPMVGLPPLNLHFSVDITKGGGNFIMCWGAGASTN